MLSQLLTQPCVITRRLASSDTDGYGNERPREDLVETVCALQQQQRSETAGEGETATGRWRLFLPAATVVTTADEIEVDGEQYEFAGAPWHVHNPRTRTESHVEATVVRTAGAEDKS